MKKQGSGKVYDSTPAKRGSRKPKDPAYTAKKNPKDLYTKKCDDSSNKENQSKGKKKDAGKDSSDPTDSGDNGDDDSSEDDEEKVTNPDDAWTFFQEACKLTAECTEYFGNLGYHTVDDLEILGSATPVDIVILTSTTITHATVTRIAIFTKFLYLRGYFKRNATLTLMARHNNNKKQPDTNDGGSEDNNSGKGLLRPGNSPIIPHFSNNIEEFEAFWAKLEIKLKQSCLGQHLERATTNKKGKYFQENTSLHWILAEAFQDTDAEHVVKDSYNNYGESGYHLAINLKNYYRSDDSIEEVQQILCMQLSALK